VTRRRIPDSISTTDRQIDKLVYELYGLTAEETGVGSREKVVN